MANFVVGGISLKTSSASGVVKKDIHLDTDDQPLMQVVSSATKRDTSVQNALCL